MKKFTAIALLVVMILALAACGKKTTEVVEVPTETTTVATTAAPTTVATTAATEAAHEMDESPKTGVADVIAALPYISGLSLTGLAAVSLTGRKKEN